MVQSALTYLPPTRQQLLTEIRRRGEARAEDLAVAVGITVGGVRQQLMALYGDGLVVYREAAEGPGRPKHYYRITPSAEALFPDEARDLLTQLTAHLDGVAPEVLEEFLAAHRAEMRRHHPIAQDATLPIERRLQAMLAAFEGQGFMPELEHAEDGNFYLNLYHCPLFQFVKGSERVCEFSKQALEDVVGPGTRRVAWRREGDPHCAYRFTLPMTCADS